MVIHNKPIADIIPYASNAKKHDRRQINNVAESIKQYGFVQPIVIDRDGVIVIGHCRAMAAKKLGMEEVPCVCVDDLTPEQVNALRLVDNKSNESDWDFDLLADELPGLDLSAFDFDWGLPIEDESEVIEDTAPDVDTDNEPVTKLGDVWQLGRHRLMCGDSTSIDTVETLMGGRWPTWCSLTRPMDTITRAICGKKPSGLMCSKMMIKFSTSSQMCGLCAMGSFLSAPHGRCLINGFPFSKNTTTLLT